jgi:uncharacterized protein (DUF305 family)
MNSLKNKEGAEFDKAYLDEMIKHHKSGIDMMDMAVEKADSEDVRKMSEDMIKHQTEEIKKMEKMLNEM